MRALWLFLFLIVHQSPHQTYAAFPIISTYTSNFLAPSQNPSMQNQTVSWQQTSLTIECTAANAQGNIQVGDITYSITCNPPKYLFDTTLRGFVPEYGTLYSTEICLVDKQQALGSYNYTATLPPTVGGGPSRRLLSFFDTITNAFDNYVGGVVCTASLGFAGNCDNNGGGGGIDQYARDALINQAAKLTSYIQNMTVWQNTADTAISDLQTANQGITATVQNMASQLNTAMAFSSQLNNTVYALALNQNQQAAKVNSDFQGVYNNMTFLGKEILQGQQSVAKLQNVTFTNFQKISLLMQQTQTNQANQNTAFYQKLHQITRMVKVLANTVRKQALQLNVRNAVTASVFGQAAVAASKGEVMLIHPSYPGQAPATSFPNTLLKTTLDRLYLSYINSSGGVDTAWQTGVNVYCNLNAIQNYGFDTIDYEDMYDLIGPAGCAAGGPSSALTNCLCWMEVTVTSCQRVSGFRFDTIHSQNRANFALQSSMCAGGSTPVTSTWWNARLFDSMATFNTQILGPICSMQLTTAIPVMQFSLFSARLGYMNFEQTPLNEIAAVCALNLFAVFESTQYAATMSFNFIQTLMVSYSSMFADDNPILQYEYGFPPNYVSYRTNPFRLMPNNQTYTCYTASIMGVSTTTKPAFEITPTTGEPVVTTATIVARDKNGNVVSNSLISSTIVPSVPLTNLLPQSGDVIFDIIEPQGFQPPTSVVYDYPRGSAGLAPPRVARQGMLTYPIQPVPSGFNLANPAVPWPKTATLDVHFALDNGVSMFWDHVMAMYTLNQVAVPFQFNAQAQQQICQTPTGQVPNWLCEFLGNWVLSSETNFRAGTMVAQALDFTYLLTLNVNAGEVVQRVYPGCPDISFSKYQNGAITYTLTNSLPTDVNAVVRILIHSGLCPNPGDLDVDLIPKQVFSRTIAACGNMTLQVFQKAVGSTNLISCGSPWSLNVQKNSVANLPPNTNDFNQTQVTSSFLTSLQYVVLVGTGLFRTLGPLLAPTLTPNLTDTQRSNAIDQALINFIAQSTQLATGTFIGNVTATQVYESFLPQLNNISSTFYQQATQTQADITAVKAANAKTASDIVLLNKEANSTAIAVAGLVAADAQVEATLAAIKDGSVSIEPCPDCPHFPFIYQLCCAIDNIAQFLANILMYVAIIFAIVGFGYGLFRLIRYCQAQRNKEAENQEQQTLMAHEKTDKLKHRLESEGIELGEKPETAGKTRYELRTHRVV